MESHNHHSSRFIRRRKAAAFTLVELFAVIGIVGVLAAIIIPTVGACRRAANQSREVSAARQLMVAYLLEANENRGRLMSARDTSASAVSDALTEGGASVKDTVAVGVVVAARWPHRLRPYLGDRFKNTLYVNKQAAFYDAAQANGGSMTDYLLSTHPSFGMNGGFVGGISYTDARKRAVPDQPVQRLNQAASPSNLIAFVSAHDRSSVPTSLNLPEGGDNVGYFSVEAPDTWPAANLTANPTNTALDFAYGFVAYRYGDKAVTAFLDGHVELKTCAELRDMRLWSNQARLTNNPAYTPGS